MAKVVRGHALRSNQYLLARVYEAAAAGEASGEMLDTKGNKVENKNTYINGQILVIKGTEVSFYIPPTGIEVIPINNDPNQGYVREAITLERLEYAILKDEDGNKTYKHGPAVVFPKPTETFVASRSGSYIFRAIELSKISGIYVKVIAEYKENGVTHPIGEELFITGDDQMIYYPRPEHAIINYDEKLMHHAIAIPEGEGRYVMDRMTGHIRTVRGPAMYLPDPRYEVIVKRKLTENQCRLWFPGNQTVLDYNRQLSEKSVEKSLKNINLDQITAFCSTSSYETTLANLEAKANISRGTSYTKPRTITLDNKLDGVVSLDIWTGYAVDVVSKNGNREVVCGPQTVLLDYDQTLEVLSLSTGCPKNADKPLNTVFLRYENNKVSDYVDVETKDFVNARVKVSYCVNFNLADKDKWFNIDNYVKYLCDRQRSLIKREVKKYTIEEFYQNYSKIIHDIAVAVDCPKEKEDHPTGRYFPENGMYVYDAEVLSISVENSIEDLLEQHQYEMVQKSLELADAAKSVEIAEALAEAELRKKELAYEKKAKELELKKIQETAELEAQAEIARIREVEALAAKKAQKDLQDIMNVIQEAELARKAKEQEAKNKAQEDAVALKEREMKAYADTVAKVMESIGPDLVAALTTKSNNDMLEAVAGAIGPYAMAKGESVSQFVNTLLRGTSLEDTLKSIKSTT